ncbi:MAG TPA: zf-TFIIB domain-containing protein [Mycobacteriales bacterium]|nr:zf-TFIIB domain-containing protein [Mycobacteriales bacterium]
MNAGPICPKCGADMRAYERNGVTIDQCTGCRGLFLDRGELERLVDAESAYYAQRREPERGHREPERGHREPEHGRRDHDDDDRSHRQYGSGQKRKGSFLDELFG